MNNDVNKEIEEWFLDLEDSTLDKIKKTYDKSLKDVQAKAKELQDEIDKLSSNADPNDEIRQSQIRSKVYQLDYQQRLEKQISNLMDVANDKNYKTVRAYLYNVYHDGFLTEQYRLMSNGINITMPINQKLLVKAVNTTFDDIPLSKRIYGNVDKAKQSIISEISRGLSIGMSNQDMARNLKNSMGVSMRKAFQIAQNEGARVRQSAIQDSMFEAKKKGADIVKQWSATLDGKTRPHHRELDGQYAEIDEKFKYSGGEVNAPKEFGIASEDINCRCTLLSVPRWDMTKTHWQRDNVTKELVEVENYQDWYNKYYVVNVPQAQKTVIVRNYDNQIAKKIGKDKYDLYMDALEGCENEDIKKLYNQFLDDVKIIYDGDGIREYFNSELQGIIVNVDRDLNNSENTFAKYEAFFHESAHNIDFLMNNKNRKEFYSNVYNNKGTIIDTIKQEVDELVDNAWQKLNDELEKHKSDVQWLLKNGYTDLWDLANLSIIAEKHGKTQLDILTGRVKYREAIEFLPKVSKEKACKDVEQSILNDTSGNKKALSDISDILMGVTDYKIVLGFGHEKGYYNDVSIAGEAFAEITSAYITNKDSLDILKRYLPKTVEKYNNMVRDYLGEIK